ncbi:MAG: hypothetical protein JXR59_08120 [Desulfuromonadaceae bacterium]|nr:hypothetical protein [Desulfuromonadaceae bacterium]
MGTSLLCFVLAAALRLNHAVIQAINYLLYPLQLALLWPFFCGGRILFAEDHSVLTPDLLTALRHSTGQTLNSLGQANCHALTLWLLVAGLSFPLLYLVSRFWMGRLAVPKARISAVSPLSTADSSTAIQRGPMLDMTE